MKKVIIQFDGVLIRDELERIEEQFKHDLEQNGFIVIDNRYKVIEFEDGRRNDYAG